MKFGHEKLDVYKVSLQYFKWIFEIADRLTGKFRHSRDHLLRAFQSITYNISEGNGKTSKNDRSRFFEISRGSALECASVQDVLQIGDIISEEENEYGKDLLVRIVSMLTKMIGKINYVREESEQNNISKYKIDYDNDYDSDSEEF